MAYIFDEVWVNNGQLVVGDKNINPPDALGKGAGRVRHSAYIEGPLQVGNSGDFSVAEGTVMIGKDGNTNAPVSLHVKGDGTNAVYIDGDLFVSGNTDTGNKGRLASRFATADSKPVKPFDIEHPTKGKGYRLRHASLEGPESGVYFRGRLKNQNKIKLPNYWKELVHTDSISVQLQPIGAHQNIIIKRWDDEFVYLQGQGAMPINCFFHVYGERKDVNSMMVEYEGNDRYDYPDPNFVENSSVHYEDRNYKDPQYNFPRNTITY